MRTNKVIIASLPDRVPTRVASRINYFNDRMVCFHAGFVRNAVKCVLKLKVLADDF